MYRGKLTSAAVVFVLLLFTHASWTANIPNVTNARTSSEQATLQKGFKSLSDSKVQNIQMSQDFGSNAHRSLTTASYLDIFRNAGHLLHDYTTGFSISEYAQAETRGLFQSFEKDLIPALNTRKVSEVAVSDIETCQQDIDNLVSFISNGTEWALLMFDAWGKPGSGLLKSQGKFLGDFDGCRDTTPVGQNYETQYCLETFYIQIVNTTVPNQILTFTLGTCVPSTCQAQDLKIIFNEAIQNLPVNITAGVSASSCVENEVELNTKAIAVLCVCGVFASLVVLATFYDILIVRGYWKLLTLKNQSNTIWLFEHTANSSFSEEKKTHRSEYEPLLDSSGKATSQGYRTGVLGRALLSFSLYTNGGKLLNTNIGSDNIDCINGIRFISMSWVILGHTFVMGTSAMDNIPSYMALAYKRWTFQAILNALVSVDTFFVLSGLLLTYLAMKELSKHRFSPSFLGPFYFHRYWRLTPPYMLVMMVYIVLLRYVSDGPLWPQAGVEQGDCQDTWWTNLLYINNVVKNEKMCMPWSWYLANDMQFFVISPLIFLPLFFFRTKGVIVAILFLIGNAIASGVISITKDLPPSILGQYGEYFNDYYIKPYTRIGPYIVGMVTGYILYVTECRVRLNRVVVLIGWALAWSVALAVLYGLYYHNNGHPLTHEMAALYNALHRIGWGLAICWVIFACATGYGGYINTILSWKGFVPLSRLTYCAYLVHPLVIYYFYFSKRQLYYLDNNNITFAFLAILVLSYAAAFIASMAFEAPMLGLEKIFRSHVFPALCRPWSGKGSEKTPAPTS